MKTQCCYQPSNLGELLLMESELGYCRTCSVCGNEVSVEGLSYTPRNQRPYERRNRPKKTKFDGHTEGPWFVNYDHGCTYRMEGDRPKGLVWSVETGYDTETYLNFKNEADEKLVQAAPELLALVKEIAEYEPPKLEDEKSAEGRLFLQNAMSLVAFKGFQKQARELLESD